MRNRVAGEYILARHVRRLVADVYGASTSAVILAPGTLVALRLVFGALSTKRLVLSAEEYFDGASFPAQTVDAVAVDDVVERVVRRRPGALLLSAVTWKGERLPLEAIFGRIRSRLGARAPLLVADYSHAGAAGFPRVTDAGADIVAGDVTKWITPPTWPDRVGFLWFRSAGHRALARELFGPFYLACPRPSAKLEARWVDPGAIEKIAAFQLSAKPTRRELVARCTNDLALAKRMAGWCHAPQPTSSLLWVRSAAGVAKIPKWAEDQGLLWTPPTGGVRVMCRSDLAP